MAFGRHKYRSRSRRSYSYAYPHHVTHGDRVTVSGRIYKHRGESERTRTRREDMPRAPQNRRRLAGRQESMPSPAPQEGIGSRIGTAIQSPVGRAAIDLAARALAARLGIPPALMPPRDDLLALPPPID